MNVTIENGRIAGTRITVYTIYHYLEGGWHHTEIAVLLGLATVQVLAAMKYIEDHREEVEAVHRQIEERNARGHSPEVQAKVDATVGKARQRLNEIRQRKAQEANGAGTPRGQ